VVWPPAVIMILGSGSPVAEFVIVPLILPVGPA
jgi:hypothetical protein